LPLVFLLVGFDGVFEFLRSKHHFLLDVVLLQLLVVDVDFQLLVFVVDVLAHKVEFVDGAQVGDHVLDGHMAVFRLRDLTFACDAGSHIDEVFVFALDF